MDSYYFLYYNKKSEEFGEDYWNFLDATTEEIIKNNIYLDNISKVIKEITNEELKIRMKKKIFDLIVENGINFNGVAQSLDIFNRDEIKLFLKKEFNTKIIKKISDEENLQYYLGDITRFIDYLENANDINWKYFMITNILNIIKNYSNKSILVNIIEYNKYRIEIYNKLINDYYNYLPDEYKNFLKMKKDHNYIYNKSLKFMNEDINIGIDPKISIGPEIEANNDYAIEIDLSNQIGFEEYRVYRDATVPNGSEVTTKRPFHNIKEDVAKFCGLCETMKDIGYYYKEDDQNASGQINLGLDYLDTKESILNFYEIYGNCEELLYYICNEEGQLFRQNVYVNSRIKQISAIIGKYILDEELSRDDVIRLFNSKNSYIDDDTIKGLKYKKNSVCLRGDSEEDYRLEFRIPNGSCNYKIWLDNIRLFGKMMEVSKRLADMMKKDYLSSEEEELLKLKINLQNKGLSIEDKLFILMDLLFKDNNIKQIYYNRYVSTIKKIKETNSNKYLNLERRYNPDFEVVEFIGQYHSRLDRDYNGEGLVIEYDPETDVISSNRKK